MSGCISDKEIAMEEKRFIERIKAIRYSMEIAPIAAAIYNLENEGELDTHSLWRHLNERDVEIKYCAHGLIK